MSERSERSSSVSSAEESRLKTDPASTERETSHSESRDRAATRRIRSLEGQLHATEQSLAEALNKVQARKPKLAEGSHYKSIIHRLRKRWYLRPFIPASLLEPPAKPS